MHAMRVIMKSMAKEASPYNISQEKIMSNVKIENIRKATLNGRKVKIFDVRRLVDNAWVFAGQFYAPARTANKNLIDHVG